MTQTLSDQVPSRGLRGGHVLAAMLAFFAVIVVADATLIYKALVTFGGLDNANAYRDGLAYNRRIASERAQARLGWRDAIEARDLPRRLTISLSEASGAALPGKRVIAEIGRPATTRFDQRLDLPEIAPGRYVATLPVVESGTWVLTLSVYDTAANEGEPRYQSRRRLWLAP